VDYTYADGQYWDITDYTLPIETDSIVATLYYQTTSKEFIEYLRDHNTTSDRGDVVYALWDTTGKSAPELMEQEYFRVIHPLAAVDDLTIWFESAGVGTIDFTLNWTPVSGASSYEVYNMASPDDLVGTLIGTIAAPPYTLTESDTWEDVRYYRVRAVE
jgi:hypothetical protein